MTSLSARSSRWTPLFFASALVNFVIAQTLCVAGLTWPTQSLLSSGTLIAVHLVTLGWLSLLMFGALFQFVPVITSQALPSHGLALATLLAMEVGLLAMLFGFAGWLGDHATSALALPAGGGLVLVGALTGAATLWLPLWRSQESTLPGRLVRIGLLFLIVTLLLGVGLALTFTVPAVAAAFTPLAAGGRAVHLMAGLVGWFMLTAIGVSYKLLPMFMLAPEDRGRLGGSVMWLGGVGCALLVSAGGVGLWFPGRLERSIEILGGLIAVTGFIVYLADVVRLYRSRRRVHLELHNRMAICAFAALAIALLWLAAALLSRRLEAQAPALVYLVMLGWLSGLGLTQLYKIVAFLTWLQRYGSKLGRGPVPKVQALVNERRAMPWFIAYFVSVAITTVALASGWVLPARAGVAVSLLATLALAHEYWLAWRCYYVSHPSAAATPPLPPPFPRRTS